MLGERASLRFICLVAGILLSAISYTIVLLHFVLAKNQFEHDGDNMYFIPVFFLLFVSLAIYGMRKLTLNDRRGLAFTACVSVFLLIVVFVFFSQLPNASAVLFSPAILACLAGGLIGFGQTPTPNPSPQGGRGLQE
jgi:L-asparagine transporter-like permease